MRATASHYFSLPASFFSDFAEPLTLPSEALMDPGPSTSESPMGGTPPGNSPPEESISILTSMGFPRAHSIQALKATVSLLPSQFTSKMIRVMKDVFSWQMGLFTNSPSSMWTLMQP